MHLPGQQQEIRRGVQQESATPRDVALRQRVDEKQCAGRRKCDSLCPYGAITYDEVKKRSVIISAACKACGRCTAACPCGASAATCRIPLG